MSRVQVDHLSTRASVSSYRAGSRRKKNQKKVANAAGTVVWQWNQVEPFGNNFADENPNGLGAFVPLAGE